jgi:hypothetical protein
MDFQILLLVILSAILPSCPASRLPVPPTGPVSFLKASRTYARPSSVPRSSELPTSCFMQQRDHRVRPESALFLSGAEHGQLAISPFLKAQYRSMHFLPVP